MKNLLELSGLLENLHKLIFGVKPIMHVAKVVVDELVWKQLISWLYKVDQEVNYEINKDWIMIAKVNEKALFPHSLHFLFLVAIIAVLLGLCDRWIDEDG